MNTIKLKAYAKINLTLDITGKRNDGYHLLDSIMQSISLCDTVTLEKSSNITVDCNIDGIKDNIAYLSALKFFEYTNICGGVKIGIDKNIPLSSGMGGGSADAGAVICGLNALYQARLDKEDLCKIGLSVGADVPFCIVGGTARVRGIGEKVESLPDIPNCYIVVIKSGEKSSTKDMYQKLDCKQDLPQKTSEVIDAIKDGNIYGISSNLGNAFGSVFDYTDIKDEFLKTQPLGISLSGSGPTVFGIYDDKDKAERAARQLNGTLALPQKSGIKFE